MSTAKVIEIIAQSDKSFEDAIRQGVAEASARLDGVKDAWVKDIKAVVENGKISLYRATLHITFVLSQEKRKR